MIITIEWVSHGFHTMPGLMSEWKEPKIAKRVEKIPVKQTNKCPQTIKQANKQQQQHYFMSFYGPETSRINVARNGPEQPPVVK